MRVIGNILWLILAGLWLAIGYVLAGLLAFVLIVTIPFGVACWKMIPLSLVPLGREIVPISSAASDPYGIPA
jgi:uncharacterized membrane protein YccF (DUF307 family)